MNVSTVRNLRFGVSESVNVVWAVTDTVITVLLTEVRSPQCTLLVHWEAIIVYSITRRHQIPSDIPIFDIMC